MFRNKTLFVIGAGASAEVGLPIGSKLAELIATLLRFDESKDFLQHMPRGRDQKEYLHAARRISENVEHVKSIDNYLDTFSADATMNRVGKAAIVYSILHHESKSHLRLEDGERRIPLSRYKSSWYAPFFQILVDDIRPDKLTTIFDNIAIICFNYDRCIEYFLATELGAFFGLRKDEAHDLLARLNIFHPYGTVGDLSLQIKSEEPPHIVSFGADPNFENVFTLGSRIRTYTEEISQPERMQRMHEEIATAQTIVFLGFGFYSKNLQLLKPQTKAAATGVIATGVHTSRRDRESIISSVRDLCGKGNKFQSGEMFEFVEIDEWSCAKLFEVFGRSLSAR